MHKQLPTWLLIQNSLQQNIEVMLLYVLESRGSSPGRQGFFMAVNATGEMSGSLGGGIMEHKFVEMAKSKLKQAAGERSVHQQLHDKQAAKNQSGMICSGEQTIFLYTLQPQDAATAGLLIQSMQQNKNGTLQLSPAGISFVENIPPADFSFEINADADFIYREKTGYKNYLYIIGGGHCALAFSQLMSGMDFYIQLFDDRAGLLTIDQNHFVQECKLLENYKDLTELIPSGKNNYVVIMTVGYRTDELALKALLGKDFKYFGILGSKNKIVKMFENLVREGIAPDLLDRIHAPIGLSIKSQTTEEIAVSIAAEIILVKNRELV
ncbi:MAG: XdhC family protein [Ferruginibacter sp.]|nr:XdhC family protein [Ferruginibacter sp.]